MAYKYNVENLCREVEKLKPQVEKLATKVESLEVSEKVADVAQVKDEFVAMRKTINKFEKYLEAMRPILETFGTYTYADGRTALGIITRVFPTAGTVDIMVLDAGGSGGTYLVDNKTIGTGKEEIKPFLYEDIEEEDEEEEDELGAAATTEEIAEPVMAA